MIRRLSTFVVLVVVLLTGCHPVEKLPSIDAWARDFDTLEEKVSFLEQYVDLPTTVLDTDFHILEYDYSEDRHPAPPDWDYLVVVRVDPQDVDQWVGEYEKVVIDTVHKVWWSDLDRQTFPWPEQDQLQVYQLPEEPNFIAISPSEGLVWKLITTMREGNVKGRTLESFQYSYGSFHGGQWDFQIDTVRDNTLAGPKYILTARGSNGVDLNVTGEVQYFVMDDIEKIIDTYALQSWDGFDSRDPSILDGYGFTLSAGFVDGSITASGYMKYPPNYHEAHAKLEEYLTDLAQWVETHQ
ncbi:MAG: hypothetical protein FWG15_07765 [Propionibacteriaceae bacterium]|nr:hypothetical protein [Propionibacteriaceae bacterium]